MKQKKKGLTALWSIGLATCTVLSLGTSAYAVPVEEKIHTVPSVYATSNTHDPSVEASPSTDSVPTASSSDTPVSPSEPASSTSDPVSSENPAENSSDIPADLDNPDDPNDPDNPDTPTEETESSLPFVDVPDNAWFAPAVQYATSNNLMEYAVQMTHLYFYPNTSITRAQVAYSIYQHAKMLNIVNLKDGIGWQVRSLHDYADVQEQRQQAVAFCYNTKIMKGDTHRMFYPNKPITRQEFAVVLRRYVQYMEDQSTVEGIQSSSGIPIEEFLDAKSMSYWAKDSIAFCLKNGLLNGKDDGSFQPRGNVTMAQMAQVLYNFKDKLKVNIIWRLNGG